MLIGILQTDSVVHQFQPKFGDYPQMFMELLEQSAGRDLHFRAIDCQAMDYPRAESCDAYIITGSRFSVYDDEPWIPELVEFVDRALQADRKVVGICFGHQLIAHFFGGETAEVGWAVGVHRCDVVATANWMRPAKSGFALLSSHKDQVVELPTDARLLVSSDFCPNSGYAIGEQVFTLQGHPEFSKPYARALLNLRRELLGQATFQQGMRSLAEDTHERDMAMWITNFIGG